MHRLRTPGIGLPPFPMLPLLTCHILHFMGKKIGNFKVKITGWYRSNKPLTRPPSPQNVSSRKIPIHPHKGSTRYKKLQLMLLRPAEGLSPPPHQVTHSTEVPPSSSRATASHPSPATLKTHPEEQVLWSRARRRVGRMPSRGRVMTNLRCTGASLHRQMKPHFHWNTLCRPCSCCGLIP